MTATEKAVPREPTIDMIVAGEDIYWKMRKHDTHGITDFWQAMYDAAPAPSADCEVQDGYEALAAITTQMESGQIHLTTVEQQCLNRALFRSAKRIDAPSADSREAFEAWARRECHWTEYHFHRDLNGIYDHFDVQRTWLAWSARDAEIAALDRERTEQAAEIARLTAELKALED